MNDTKGTPPAIEGYYYDEWASWYESELAIKNAMLNAAIDEMTTQVEKAMLEDLGT